MKWVRCFFEILKPMAQEKISCRLQKQDSRHSDYKIPVLRFVTEELHTGDGADAAAQKSREKQGFLRNPPFVTAGFFLVDAHQGEGKEVDKEQVKDNRCG